MMSKAHLCRTSRSQRRHIPQSAPGPRHPRLARAELPGIDGLQTAVEICKRLPHCKLILISGQPESIPQLERAAMQGLQFSVLAKPIPPGELLATIESLCSTAVQRVRAIQEVLPRSGIAPSPFPPGGAPQPLPPCPRERSFPVRLHVPCPGPVPRPVNVLWCAPHSGPCDRA